MLIFIVVNVDLVLNLGMLARDLSWGLAKFAYVRTKQTLIDDVLYNEEMNSRLQRKIKCYIVHLI